MRHYKQLLGIAFSFILLTGCGENKPASDTSKADSPSRQMSRFVGGSAATNDVFIPADSANKMISSYLTSIHATANDSDLHSLIFNGDSLRAYLTNPAIKHVKVSFAHTLDYINQVGPGRNVGYESGALTLIISGYDEAGNYVFWNDNNVCNHARPCPTNCATSGTAQSDLFPINH